MKSYVGVLFFSLSLGSVGQVLAATLPDSCGDGKITYQVKTEKGVGVAPAPVEGNAELVFIERENEMVVPFHSATVRLGMDGRWVGADYSNSYFAVSVAPGEHHLCANWQSNVHKAKKTTDVTSFTAEAGKVYYVVAQVTVGSNYDPTTFSVAPADDDKAKWWLMTSKHSVSSQRQ